jgi:hypothetical protein
MLACRLVSVIGRIAPDLSVLSQCAYVRLAGRHRSHGDRGAGPFSLVYLVYNTLFNLPSQERQTDCFRNVAKVLGPGGLFVIECFIQDLTEFDRGQRVATRALTEDSVEMEFLTDDPVAQAVTYQRVTFDAWGTMLRPLRERYQDRDRGPFTGESQDHISVYEVIAAPGG